MATSDNIIGTSTNTPTTVARAAPEFRPNKLMATATASSKKLDVQPLNLPNPSASIPSNSAMTARACPSASQRAPAAA